MQIRPTLTRKVALVVKVEVCTLSFNEDIQQAQSHTTEGVATIGRAAAALQCATDRFGAKVERLFARLMHAFDGQAGWLRNGPASLTAGVGVGAVIGTLKGITHSLVRSNATAEGAGFPMGKFQRFTCAAAVSSVSLQAGTDCLKELRLQADQPMAKGASPQRHA